MSKSTAKALSSEVTQVLIGLSFGELQSKLSEIRKNLYVLKMGFNSGELKQPHLIRNARREIARIATQMSSL